MRAIAILTALAGVAHAACVQVASDRIVARHLSSAVPLLQGLDPETPIGFAPMPGAQRIVAGRELKAILQRHGLAPDAGSFIGDVCVERTVRVVSREEMAASLAAALAIPDASVELIEFSSQPLPPGRVEFQRSELAKPFANPDAPVIWRGKLIYEGQHSLSIWAKVKITVERTVFLAAEDIAAGAVIRAGQVKTACVRQFPFSGSRFESAGDIVGRVARRSIPAGKEIVPGAIEKAKDVARGDKVHVRVIAGNTMLSFDALAESSGNSGDAVLVRNSLNDRAFRAIVEEKGKVVVRPQGD